MSLEVPTAERVFEEDYWGEVIPVGKLQFQGGVEKDVREQEQVIAGIAAAAILSGEAPTWLEKDTDFDPTPDNQHTQSGSVLLCDFEYLARTKSHKPDLVNWIAGRLMKIDPMKPCGQITPQRPQWTDRIADNQELAASATTLFRLKSKPDKNDSKKRIYYPYRRLICSPSEDLHYYRDVKLITYLPNKNGEAVAHSSFQWKTDGAEGELPLYIREILARNDIIPKAPVGTSFVYDKARGNIYSAIRLRAAAVCMQGVIDYAPARKEKRAPVKALGRLATNPTS